MAAQIDFSCAVIGIRDDADENQDFDWFGLKNYSFSPNDKLSCVGDNLTLLFSSSKRTVISVLYFQLLEPYVGTVRAIQDRCRPFLVPNLYIQSLDEQTRHLTNRTVGDLSIQGDPFKRTERVCDFIVIITWIPRQKTSVGNDHGLKSIYEEVAGRKDVLAAAKTRGSPSSGAKLSSYIPLQDPSVLDAAFNYRPLYRLKPSPVSINEPIFGQFVTEIHRLVLKPSAYKESERQQARKIVEVNSMLHKQEHDRCGFLRGTNFPGIESLWDEMNLRINGSSTIKPDGGIKFPLEKFNIQAVSAVAEVKNGLGEGGYSPEVQCMNDYRKVVSSDDFEQLRRVSSCPMFLIALTGTHLIIWGAVTADRFFFQPLTYIITDPKLRPVGCPVDTIMLEVAGVFCALRKCLDALKTYYEGLSPLPEPSATPRSSSLARSTASSTSRKRSAGSSGPTRRHAYDAPGQFPRWSKFTEDGTTKQYEVTYVRRIVDDFSKPVYQAKAVHTQNGVEIESKDVVVKFTHRYFPEAHRLLAENGFAPKLLYAALEEFEVGTDAPGMWVVVMEHLKDVSHPDSLSEVQKKKLEDCVEMLHEKKYVHGDLRRPNIFIRGTDELFLIDFDWSGEDGVVTYPMDICMDKEMNWHPRVNCGNTIFKEHDNHRVNKILAGEE